MIQLATAQFYTATIVLVSISIALAVMSLNFFHRPPGFERAPGWLRRLFLQYLTPVLFPLRTKCAKRGEGVDLRRIMDCNGDLVGPMKLPSYHSHQSPPSPKLPAAATRRLASHHESCGITEHALGGSGGGNSLLMDCFSSGDNNGIGSSNAATNIATTTTTITPTHCASCNSATNRNLSVICDDLHSMIEDRQDDEEKGEIISEWKQIAYAFDRFGLVLFIIATVILSIILCTELSKNVEN